MWIVRLALRRPYSVAVFCLTILLLGVLVATRMITDVLPVIDIPVVVVVWNYNGLSAEDMESRIVYIAERAYSSTVAGIEHIDSESIPNLGILRVYFQQDADIGAAIAQITGVSLTASRFMPPGITPPVVLQYNASNVPVAQLTMASKAMSEQELYDYGLNFLRLSLFTIPGLSTPAPYGGATRQLSVDVYPDRLSAVGLSALDIVNTLQAQNVIVPGGFARIGTTQFDFRINGSPKQADEFNQIPIKVINGATVRLGDVAHAYDGFAVQENVVRVNGKRSAYLSILRKVGASTIAVVDAVRKLVPRLELAAPKPLELKVEFDQSVFVRAAVQSVLREGATAAALVSIMVLLFIGSWRSMLIVMASIPVSILVGLLGLFATGQSLNVMTLGGLALAIGMLVDDATVEIENINRNRAMNKPLTVAILDGARQVAVPALAATLTICIVFFPVVLLAGPAKYLFTPLALAVVFSMLASYLLSRTLVTSASRLLLIHEPPPEHTGEGATSSRRGTLWQRANRWRDDRFDDLRVFYGSVLRVLLRHRAWTLIGGIAVLSSTIVLATFVGVDFFPSVDAGQMQIHFRAPIGTRIEETERLVQLFEDDIRRIVPPGEVAAIDDTIGVPTSYNLGFVQSDSVGEADADISVALKPGHAPTIGYMRRIREEGPRAVPGATFYFQPASIIDRVLDFGLPAPIDVQIEGREMGGNLAYARMLLDRVKRIPGAVDVRMPQIFNQPAVQVAFDRERGARIGLTEAAAANNLVTTLASDTFISPNFWINPSNGVNYFVSVQTPIALIQSMGDVTSTPLGLPGQATQATLAPSPQSPTPASTIGLPPAPTIVGNQAAYLQNVSTFTPTNERLLINHYTVQPILDVQCSVDGRALGEVASDIQRAIDSLKGSLPKTSSVIVRGQSHSMTTSFLSLAAGMVLAAALVYLLLVVLFQSWLDPLIIMCAIPGALIGAIWMLAVTGTTLNIESLMGLVMSIGIAASNSILLVSFANDVRVEKKMDALSAAIEAGMTRLRPVLMTALAMLLGMLPMALALGEGGEQNAPLGRAVIGGILVATTVTLFIVPVVYSLLRTKEPTKQVLDERFAEESRGAEGQA